MLEYASEQNGETTAAFEHAGRIWEIPAQLVEVRTVFAVVAECAARPPPRTGASRKNARGSNWPSRSTSPRTVSPVGAPWGHGSLSGASMPRPTASAFSFVPRGC